MQEEYRRFIILCEGASEYNYLKLLNRFLRENERNVSLIGKKIGTGHFGKVKSVYRAEKRKDNDAKFVIWIDFDIYKRNDKHNYDKLMEDRHSQQRDKISDHIKFSHMNFEDFFSLHFDDVTFAKWQQVCRERGHCQTPLHDEDYRRLYRQHVLSSYEKGKNPKTLEKQDLINLKKHCAASGECPGSEFGQWLLDEVLGGLVPQV